MGGYGSTRWSWHNKRDTAEQSKRLQVKQYHGYLRQIERGDSSGFTLAPSWTCGDRPSGSVTLILSGSRDEASAWLDYAYTAPDGHKTQHHYRVGLEYSLTPWGSRRYWWTCPNCGKRCGTLYMPPGAARFACRKCHNLTYQKCQESHQHEGFYRQLAGQVPGMTPAYLKTIWEDHALEDLIAGKRDGKRLTRKQKIKLYKRLVPPEEQERRINEILEEMRQREAARWADYLTPDDLCHQAGLTAGDLQELEAARLLLPDHEGLYRPKLAGWARKLAYLLYSGWTIPEVTAWARGRWKTANPRAWPPERDDWKNLMELGQNAKNP